MNPDEYVAMRQQEETHWWYRTLRSAALRQLRLRLGTSARPPRLLDAGCGTGGMSAVLRGSFPEAELTAVDLDEQAVAATAARGVADGVVRASVNALPLRSGVFDAAVFLDVLYHAGVDEDAAVSELRRVLRGGGLLIINVPAFEALRGAHDVAVHTERRYTPRRLRDLARAHELRVEHWTCWNTTLLPLLWAWRQVGRLRGSGQSDLRPVPSWLNEALAWVLRGEWRVADRTALPLGSSLFAVLRRPGAT